MEVRDVLKIINKEMKLLEEEKERFNVLISNEYDKDVPDGDLITHLFEQLDVIRINIDFAKYLFLKINDELKKILDE